jgi:tetratricopeptide (TPR) repeat protein
MATRLILIVALSIASTAALAMGPPTTSSRSSPPSSYEKGAKAAKSGEYAAALKQLEKAVGENSRDANAWNYMGYSYRKLKQFDQALFTYQKALAIDPEHHGANEYLGELYLETGQLEKAKERLKVLDSACFFGCREYDSLKSAIAAYKAKHK